MSHHFFGQFAVPEPPHNLAFLHLHRGERLDTTTDEPKCGVLDQQTLFAQGIDTSKIVAGAPRVNALGDCTANATIVDMSNVLPEDEWCHFATASSFEDVVGAECGAIRFYAEETHQTGTPGQEWPPTDCGSSGPYIVQELERLGLIKGQRIASGAQNIVSLMQHRGLLMGGPFLNAWMTPGPNAMVDGNGTATELALQLRQGVAGGHETRPSAIEKLTLTETGAVTAEKTVIRVRNSWGHWGDHGSFRIHLSTLERLGRYYDFRQVYA